SFGLTSSDPDALRGVTVVLDGGDVTASAALRGDSIELRPTSLDDGKHYVEMEVSRGLLMASFSHRWTFWTDSEPPRIEMTAPQKEVLPGAPVTLAGRAHGATRVTIEGEEIPLTDAGNFEIALKKAPTEPLRVAAEDASGNTASKAFDVRLGGIRAAHVSAYGWASSALRSPLMRMLKKGQINSVQLDLKDESGLIGYDSKIPLARKIGSVQGVYDLEKAVKLLHDQGAQVVGRIVAFRDPILAKASWNRGHRERVIQTPGGRAYGGYGGFTNFADPTVRDYNISIAEEAAQAGVDDILYDYVRRPDGPVQGFVFKGLRGSPEAAIASFLADTRKRIAPYGASLAASVYGIAATRPREIAQDIARMAEHCDYIAPMIYPSHWAPGEYGVSNPNANPYAIVRRSLKDFQREVRGTGARVVPWLQDFSLGIHYGEGQVRAQIQATLHAGIDEWILWDPKVTYTSAALDPR
ncbi:MAG: putative glycoside hydrolase, partial [Actinomycetota bacterium]|nr:putative glycoside hydrolase [Actinomycetota bacterium]